MNRSTSSKILLACFVFMLTESAQAALSIGQQVRAQIELFSRTSSINAPWTFGTTPCTVFANTTGTVTDGPRTGVITGSTTAYNWYKISWAGDLCSTHGWSADTGGLSEILCVGQITSGWG